MLRAAYPSSKSTFGFGTNFLSPSWVSVAPINVRSAMKTPLSWIFLNIVPAISGVPGTPFVS